MLNQFFIRCSGADTDILSQCSQGERTKYAGIGATVFFTALMAFIASSYALYTVFDSIYIALLFGLVWGLLIFNLDRYIVSTIKKSGSTAHQFWQALPRLVLAVIIAIVISKPLELKIFEKEIDQVLLQEKNTLTLANQEQLALQYTPKVEALEQDVQQLKNEIITKEEETNALYATYIAEAEGKAGTGLLGKGPVYQEKRDKHDAALAELQQLKISNREKIEALDAQIAALKLEYNSAVENAQPIIDRFDGLMARIDAMKQLPWIPSFFIFLLFLTIETAPIINKLIASKGEYDFRLEENETIVSSWINQKVTQRQLVVSTDQELNKEIYNDLKSEKEVYEYKKKKAEELLKLQADSFHKVQTKGL
ncbi:DUF4407 domain-containing protein [Croceivirga sp. JEA036]|uniref:DUF4407 domain-containing protein n=1 Tax=Croceivirga sp. JEA036 TaxID=2721162 RepID=UPI001439F04C|nr:DUF4407 domain-containing protein [Croceivirga sp. JEA036]NJB36298.1 DUF4407 domain-containing protein [Croceivirga sp. JEA036]